MKAIFEYPETQEDEEVDLNQLLEDGEVALSTFQIHACCSSHAILAVQQCLSACSVSVVEVIMPSASYVHQSCSHVWQVTGPVSLGSCMPDITCRCKLCDVC